MSTAALCAADCRIRNRHLPDCTIGDDDDNECWGCLPRQAADGLYLCDLHTERLVDDACEAPQLYDDLGLILVRRGAGGERTSGSSSAAPVPDDDVMDAREAIRRTLLRLTKLVVDERGVAWPTVHKGVGVHVDTRPPGLSEFVARHGLWLAGHRDAGEHSRALHAATRGKARALAYPAGTDRLYIGDCPLLVTDQHGAESVCGTRLYQYPDQPLVECRGCGTQETIEQWVRWMVPDTSPVADAYAIAAHLAIKWMRPVDPATIRGWAHRGRITPVTRSDPSPSDPDRVAIVRDERSRTQYRVIEVVDYARKAWGEPYRPQGGRNGTNRAGG